MWQVRRSYQHVRHQTERDFGSLQIWPLLRQALRRIETITHTSALKRFRLTRVQTITTLADVAQTRNRFLQSRRTTSALKSFRRRKLERRNANNTHYPPAAAVRDAFEPIAKLARVYAITGANATQLTSLSRAVFVCALPAKQNAKMTPLSSKGSCDMCRDANR